MNLKRWFVAFGLQGASLSALTLVMSLFTITGLRGNVKNASVVVALYSFGNLFGALVSGVVLDRIKNLSPIIFASLFSAAIVSILMPFSYSMSFYYILSILLGLSVSFIGPSITLFLSNSLPAISYRKNLNALNLLNSIGATSGTFIGGILLAIFYFLNETTRMTMIFVFSSVIFAIASILISTTGETLTEIIKRKISTEKDYLKGIHLDDFPKGILSSLNLKGLGFKVELFMLAVLLSFFGANMLFSIFSIYLQQYLKIGPQIIFVVYGANSIAGNIGFYLTRLAMKNFKDFKIIKAVLYARALAILLIILVGLLKSRGISIWITYFSFVIIGFTWPFFYIPVTIQATNLTSPENRGRILGIFNASINLAVITASFISGAVALKFGYLTSFLIGAVLLVISEKVFTKALSTETSKKIKIQQKLQ
jgi:MFS family permease